MRADLKFSANPILTFEIKNAQPESRAEKRKLRFAAKQNRSPHDKYAKIEHAFLPNVKTHTYQM